MASASACAADLAGASAAELVALFSQAVDAAQQLPQPQATGWAAKAKPVLEPALRLALAAGRRCLDQILPVRAPPNRYCRRHHHQ